MSNAVYPKYKESVLNWIETTVAEATKTGVANG